MGYGQRKTIAFYIDWPESSTYHRSLLRGAHDAAVELDLDLLVVCAGNLAAEAAFDPSFAVSYRYVESGKIDGAILVCETLSPYKGSERILEKIADWPPVPLVSIGGGLEGVPNVHVRDNSSFADLLDHVFRDHGYRNPVFVSGPKDSFDSNDRKAIFVAKAKEFGIDLDDRRFLIGRFNLVDGEDAARTFWDERRMNPDVVVCANDSMAFGLIHALGKRGIRVPEDVAITGFDDLPFSEYCSSPLTTVRQPLYEEGYSAVRTLAAMIEGRSEPTEVETQLVVRNSCGCPYRSKDTWDAVSSHQQEVLHNTIKDNDDVFLSNLLSHFESFYHAQEKVVSHEGYEIDFLTYLNIESFFLTLSPRSQKSLSDRSSLAIAWNKKKKIALPENGIEFDSIDVVPDGMFGTQRWTNLVFNLTDGEGCFGTIVFDYSPEVKTRYIEVRSRFSSFLSLMRSNIKLKELYAQLKSASQKLEELSLTDDLTRHYNRRGFMVHAQRQVAYCRRNDEGFWILFIDLDGLKTINDSWGHDDGDFAIQTFGDTIRKAVRGTDIVARLGGDEFTAMISPSTETTISILRSRLQKSLDEANAKLDRPWKLAFSLGGAYSAPDDRETLDRLMRLADGRLYEEKHAKKKV